MRKFEKVMFLTLGFLMIVSPLLAQNFSFHVSGGYGLPRGQNFLKSSMTYRDHELTQIEDHYMSIGKGIHVEGGVFFPLFPRIDLRIAGVYNTMSPKIVVKRHYGSDNPDDSETYTANWMGGRVDVIFTHPFEKITAFAGVGCGLFFAKLTHREEDYITDQSVFKYETVYRFNPALGLNVFLGLSKPVGSKVSMFMEIFFQQMSFLTKEQEMLKAEKDGVSILDEQDLDFEKPGNQNIQTFKKNSIYNNVPEVIQGSSFGIKAGVRIHFGKEKNQ